MYASYDSANRLTSVCDDWNEATSTCDGTETQYTYNGDGDRIAQTVIEGGVPTTTQYLLDVATPLTMVLAETTEGETTYYLHGLDLVAESDGVSTEYALDDGLGSVRQLSDDTSNVSLAQTYDPYGNPYASAGVGQSAFGYAGEQTDGNGLVYLRARYYNPAQGRFVQADPSRVERNTYVYATSNPVMFTDPGGEICIFGNNVWPTKILPCKEGGGGGFGGAPVRPAAASTPSVTPRPFYTPTHTPSPAPTSTEIMRGLGLPMAAARLSDCGYEAKLNGLPGRDVQPFGSTASSAVRAPAHAEVMIVDLMANDTDINGDLGNFVALRIHTSNLPGDVRSRLEANVAAYQEPGYLYIGYGHLAQGSITVRSSADSPYPTVNAGDVVGMSGNTGLGYADPNTNVHLDITAFFISETSTDGQFDAAPRFFSLQAHLDYQTFIDLARSGRFANDVVDPLLIWPNLREGTTCPTSTPSALSSSLGGRQCIG